ncbi:hypothetical protein ID867_23590 [Streptomyces parvulus]|nr:hypothetical protein [Streptomyces parvulus]
MAWQIGNQAAGRMPGLDDFLVMRLLSSAASPPSRCWNWRRAPGSRTVTCTARPSAR